jgi:hypothetical protein
VDARLWQDPIAVAEKKKASLDSDIEAQRASPNVVNSHKIEELAVLLHKSIPMDASDVYDKLMILRALRPDLSR